MPLGGDPVVLTTGNAASGRGPRGRVPDVGPWAAAAADLAPDVLAVQEVDHRLARSGGVDQTAAIAGALGAAAWRFAAAVHGTPGHRDSFRPAGPEGSAPPDEPSYGVALVSRHPVPRWWEHRMAPSRVHLPVPAGAPGPGGVPPVLWVPDEPRVALAALVSLPGGAVTVVCTHLSFNPLRAAAQLREVVRWAGDLPRPVLLLGDLNLPGPVPARVTGWEAVPGAAATFPAGRPRVRLDHVLVHDPDHTWSRTEARTARLADSDHLAVTARLWRW